MARAVVMDEASAFPASAASEKRPRACRKFPIFDCPGLQSATFARALAALIDATRVAEPTWIEDLTWLLDAAPAYLAARWPTHLAVLPRTAQ